MLLYEPPLDGQDLVLWSLLLGLTAAPGAIGLVAEPHSTILLPALHGAIMDRTPAALIPIAVAITLGLVVIAALVIALAVAIWFAAHLLKMDDGATCPLEQLLAGLASQGKLALEAFWGDVPGIPGCGRFGDQHIGFSGIVVHGSTLLGLNKKGVRLCGEDALNWVDCNR